MKKDKVIVSQSNKLIEASYKMTLAEKRLVCLLTSKIHRDDKDFEEYDITISHLTDFVGLKGHFVYNQTRQLTKTLLSRVLTLPKGIDDEVQVAFLSSAEYHRKKGYVSLCFDPKIKPLLLQLKGQFTNYFLKHIANLRSVYSIRIYELLKSYQRFGRKEFTIEFLRDTFQTSAKQYTRYNDFKKRILLSAQKELRDHTDIYFEFEEIKKGRKVDSILFLIYRNIRNEPDRLLPAQQEKQTAEEILKDKLHLAGYTANPDRIIKRDGVELVEASLNIALREMRSSGKTISNPGGFIAKKLQDKAGLALLLERKKANREEKEEQDAAMVRHLERTFEKGKNSKLKELIKNYTPQQNEAFKAWVDENYPSNEFVKPFKKNGGPKLSYLKGYFLDTAIPEYRDFVKWAQSRKGITLQECPTGYRITGEQQQFL